jgi:hypothetical protein
MLTLKPKAGVKRKALEDEDEEDIGASIKRRVRRVVPKAGTDESDYDLNAESDKEEKKVEPKGK